MAEGGQENVVSTVAWRFATRRVSTGLFRHNLLCAIPIEDRNTWPIITLQPKPSELRTEPELAQKLIRIDGW
jgi:hypothetical protein